MKCLYCGSQNIFNKEHVIPQFLGTFEPINPTLKSGDKLVCQNCNSKKTSDIGERSAQSLASLALALNAPRYALSIVALAFARDNAEQRLCEIPPSPATGGISRDCRISAAR